MTGVDVKAIDVQTTKQWIDEGKAVLIDVREQNEYDQASIPGASLVPLSVFNLNALPADKSKIAIYHCRSGHRTAINFTLFLETGYREIYHMDGGIIAWNDAGFPIDIAD